MRTVLIPLDGSELGEVALVRGLELFPKETTRVILLHCMDLNYLYYNSPMLPRDFSELDEIDLKRNQDYLDKQVLRLQERGYEASSLVAKGQPSERILAVAEAQNVDEILLTTHGRSGLGRLVMGSVAEGVIRRSPVPVLVIPSAGKTSPDQQPEAAKA